MIVDITTFTLLHILISLVAIAAGLVVVGGLIAGQRLARYRKHLLGAWRGVVSERGVRVPAAVLNR
jgi:hypothetical protein